MVVLWRKMTSDSASGKGAVVPRGLYMLDSLRSLVFEIVEMRRPSGPCNRTVSAEEGWAVSSKFPVGAASRSGLIGCVVYVVWRGSQPHCRWGGVGGAFLVFVFGGLFAEVVFVDCYVAVGEGSSCDFREPCRFPCGMERNV